MQNDGATQLSETRTTINLQKAPDYNVLRVSLTPPLRSEGRYSLKDCESGYGYYGDDD